MAGNALLSESVAEKPYLAAWQDLDSTFVATATLQARECLRPLAEEAVQRLMAVAGSRAPNPSGLIQAYGNAARLCFHNGCLQRAERLLLVAIELCEEGWKQTKVAEWCSAALGPCTFLAKLTVLRGDVARARKVYDDIYAFLRHGTTFQFAGLTFTHDLWKQLSDENEEFKQVRMHAAAVYMVETAKALLIAGDSHGLLRFAENAASDAAISRASRRHLLGVAEIRAQALAGLGRYREALDEYNRIRDSLPSGNPGFLVLYTHAARACRRIAELKPAGDYLDRAEDQLQACPANVDSAVPRYYSWFAIAFERMALRDDVGAHRCAGKALSCALQGNHTVGVMRSRVLLNVTSSLTSDNLASSHSDYEDTKCEEEIQRNLYGVESVAAWLHLASAQIARGDNVLAIQSLAQAQRLSSILMSWGMPLPTGLGLKESYDRTLEKEPKTSIEDDSLDRMYQTLILFARQTANNWRAVPA